MCEGRLLQYPMLGHPDKTPWEDPGPKWSEVRDRTMLGLFRNAAADVRRICGFVRRPRFSLLFMLIVVTVTAYYLARYRERLSGRVADKDVRGYGFVNKDNSARLISLQSDLKELLVAEGFVPDDPQRLTEEWEHQLYRRRVGSRESVNILIELTWQSFIVRVSKTQVVGPLANSKTTDDECDRMLQVIDDWWRTNVGAAGDASNY
jgi:hypothetical protein